jgi:hypothetical protein
VEEQTLLELAKLGIKVKTASNAKNTKKILILID